MAANNFPKNSTEDLELLERLEDELDTKKALRVQQEARAKGKEPLDWDEVKRQLGLR